MMNLGRRTRMVTWVMVCGAGVLWIGGTARADDPPAAAAPGEAVPTTIRFRVGGEPSRELWPRLVKGQRATLRQTVQKSRRGTTQIASRIAVEIVDKVDRDWIVRWQVAEIEVPENLPEEQRRAAAAMVAGMKSPPIELAVTEGVGTVRLHDWEKARDDLLAHSAKLMKETPQPEPMTEAKVQEAIATMRGRMGTREDAETVLLREIRPFFDGAYHDVEAGKPAEEPVVLPMPMGGVRAWPAKRTVTLEPADAARPGLRTVRIEAKLDREQADAILRSMADKAKEAGSDASAIPPPGGIDMGYTLVWTLDAAKGWPVEVAYRTEQKVGDRGAWEEHRWTLIEGPNPPSAPAPAAAPGSGTARP